MNHLVRLVAYLKPYRLHVIGAVVCGGVTALLAAAHAWLVKPVLDRLFIEKDPVMLVVIPVAIFGIALLKGLSGYAHTYLVRFVGTRIIEEIQNQLYRHVILLPIRYHAKNTTGGLISHIFYDTHMMQAAFSSVIKDLVQQSLTLVALTGVLFYQNAALAGIALLGVPLLIWPLVRFGKRLKRLAQGTQEQAGNIMSVLQETLAHVRVVKAFGQEAFEAHRFQEQNRHFYRKVIRAMSISEVSRPLIETISSLGIAGIIWYGGGQIFAGAMTPGEFFSFMAATMMMYGPVKGLSAAGHLLQQAAAAAERIFATLDTPSEPMCDSGVRVISTLSGAVTFQNVSFGYDKTGPRVLSDICLSVAPGDTLALVGHSGAGKSTLVNLIPRFYEADAGEICMDGIPIRKITLASLRNQIGIVSQEVALFDATIRRNIAYGCPGATDAQVEAAAEAAYAHLFIGKMARGYDTLLEKGGSNLSGGERQRLAIARAILKNPPLLILDEATSALDTESEFIVRKAIMNLVNNRTTFVIAHRLSTIVRATCIVVMDQGRIVEMGRHEDLMRREGCYRKIYQMQFKDDIAYRQDAG